MKTKWFYITPVLAVLYQPVTFLCLRQLVSMGYKTHELSPEATWIMSLCTLAVLGVTGIALGLFGTHLLLSGKRRCLSVVPFTLFYVPAMLIGGFDLAILLIFLPVL